MEAGGNIVILLYIIYIVILLLYIVGTTEFYFDIFKGLINLHFELKYVLNGTNQITGKMYSKF